MLLRLTKERRYLSQHDLENLSEHRYSCSGRSFVEPLFQIFWNRVITCVPLSIAPNTLTLIGLIVNVGTALILAYYSPAGNSLVPPWCLLLCAFGLFFYQTLDALDGKQARRTNTCSQLGELFDHGCDAISSNFVVLGSIISVRMGDYPWLMFCQFFITVILFYMAHWQVYVTGTLQFGRLDVTETQTCVIVVYLVSSIMGVNFWDSYVPFINIEWKMVHFMVMLFGGLHMCIRFSNIILGGGVGRHGATIANTSILFPFCPIALVIGMAITIAVKSPYQVYESYPCLFLISFGMVACKVTQKLVVGHMTKSELSLFDSELIGPSLMIMNQYLFNSYFNEWIMLVICCIYSTLNMLCYTRSICIQIADYLNIYIFSVQKVAIQTKPNYRTENNVHYLSTTHRGYNQSFKRVEPNKINLNVDKKKS